MPVSGAKPKPPGQTVTRQPQAFDWTLVPDVPWANGPRLPYRRPAWPASTRRWWDVVSTMPHCHLWSVSDWRFAVSTALIADMVFCGDRMAAGELRQREKIMGVTLDSRRDLRIRYVKPESDATVAPVTNLNTRRAHLTASA